MKTNWECHSATINQWAGVLPLYTWEPFSEPTFKMNSVRVCVHVCVFAIHGREVWSSILVLGGNWASSFSSCVFMSSHIMVFACSCVYLWVHAHFSRALSLCVDARVRGNCGALSNRERCFSKGCQNEFVTQSVNLRRKGTVERETFPRHPQSVRLIKSHGWSESWETEPECAEGTCYDSKETKKLQHVSINDSSAARVTTCTWP